MTQLTQMCNARIILCPFIFRGLIPILSPPYYLQSTFVSPSSLVRPNFCEFRTKIKMVRRLAISEAESVGGLEFIGFNHDTAVMLSERYDSRDPGDYFGLYAYVKAHISGLKWNAYGDSFSTLTPAQALNRLGIRQDIQEAILDPQFDILFKTQSLHSWLLDTLMKNWGTLCQLLKNETGEEASTRLHEDYTWKTSETLLPGHTVLYRGQAATDYYRGSREFVQEDGSIDLGQIWHFDHGDFNHGSSITYLTPQYELAELWRSYTARRCKYTETWLIRIQIPNAYLTTLHQEELWYSPEWLEAVWYSRRYGEGWFDRFGLSLDLVKGHVCSSLERIFSLEVSDLPHGLQESDLMRLPSGRNAEQWAFGKCWRREQMSDAVHGKIRIHVHGPRQAL